MGYKSSNDISCFYCDLKNSVKVSELKDFSFPKISHSFDVKAYNDVVPMCAGKMKGKRFRMLGKRFLES
ncbi:hypothetical protein E2C01_006538 [Portunus trituberculatus]|uniref:Uncharacterized protein n=1 Tax=Portunus trituberculatus TaxID=210409 RepID=A0A5B7CVG8_PORTR|nr:hypothetical protein [Portunus trituberculatus]